MPGTHTHREECVMFRKFHVRMYEANFTNVSLSMEMLNVSQNMKMSTCINIEVTGLTSEVFEIG